jgi:copper resistance protein D
MSDLSVLARIVHFAATLLAAGTVCFLVLIAKPATPEHPVPDALARRCRLMLWTALALAGISGAIWLVLLAAEIAGEPIAQTFRDGTLWTVTSQTRFGQVWALRLGLAILLGLSIWGFATRYFRQGSLVIAGAFVALMALVGHSGASASAAGQAYLAVDMVHLMAAAAWVGGLPALTVLLAMTHRADDTSWRDTVIVAVRRFSVLGVISVGALLVTGSVNSWHLLGGVTALWTTAYGRLLSLKIALFAAMVAIASINRLHLTPRLQAAGAMRALIRTCLTEIILGFGIVAIVGALGTMAPAEHANHMAQKHTMEKH